MDNQEQQPQQQPEINYSDDMNNSQQTPNNSGYYQPTIMPSEKADLYDKINPQDIVDYLRYLLMGYDFDRNKQEWYKPADRKGLSQTGAMEITTLMLAVSSKNVIISKLTDLEIRARTKGIVRAAMIMCVKNWRRYGITGSDQISLVKEIVLSNTFITLKQPENAGAREFLGKSSSEAKSIIEDGTRKSGIMGLFRK
jgi:hypothetical protein